MGLLKHLREEIYGVEVDDTVLLLSQALNGFSSRSLSTVIILLYVAMTTVLVASVNVGCVDEVSLKGQCTVRPHEKGADNQETIMKTSYVSQQVPEGVARSLLHEKLIP